MRWVELWPLPHHLLRHPVPEEAETWSGSFLRWRQQPAGLARVNLKHPLNTVIPALHQHQELAPVCYNNSMSTTSIQIHVLQYKI